MKEIQKGKNFVWCLVTNFHKHKSHPVLAVFIVIFIVFTKFADIRLQGYIDDKYSVKTQEYRVCESLPALKQQGILSRIEI